MRLKLDTISKPLEVEVGERVVRCTIDLSDIALEESGMLDDAYRASVEINERSAQHPGDLEAQELCMREMADAIRPAIVRYIGADSYAEVLDAVGVTLEDDWMATSLTSQVFAAVAEAVAGRMGSINDKLARYLPASEAPGGTD